MNIDPKKKTILVATQRLMEFQNDASIGKYIDSEKCICPFSNKLQKQRKLMTLMCCLGYAQLVRTNKHIQKF